jgi:hypothetical protein
MKRNRGLWGVRASEAERANTQFQRYCYFMSSLSIWIIGFGESWIWREIMQSVIGFVSLGIE